MTRTQWEGKNLIILCFYNSSYYLKEECKKIKYLLKSLKQYWKSNTKKCSIKFNKGDKNADSSKREENKHNGVNIRWYKYKINMIKGTKLSIIMLNM